MMRIVLLLFCVCFASAAMASEATTNVRGQKVFSLRTARHLGQENKQPLAEPKFFRLPVQHRRAAVPSLKPITKPTAPKAPEALPRIVRPAPKPSAPVVLLPMETPAKPAATLNKEQAQQLLSIFSANE